MAIDKDTVKYTADLAKIIVSDEETEDTAKDLNKILNYIGIMDELDTQGVEPMSHVLPLKNIFREDVVMISEDRENILRNAPKQKDGYFTVPKTVD